MIDKNKINKVQSKLKELISELEKEEGVTINFSSIRYNDAYYTTTMKVSTIEKSKKVNNILELTCKSLGFTQNIIGMRFESGDIYEITDIRTRNRKYPIIVKNLSDNKMYKYTVSHVKKLIGGDKVINRNANLERLIK